MVTLSQLQRRIYIRGAIYGSALALLIMIIDLLGWIAPLESWLYDLRAGSCQYFTPAPSRDVVYLDIDDDALDTIQRWPWDRSRMAAVLRELKLASPKVVMLDIVYAEPQAARIEQSSEKEFRTIEEDASLADAMRDMGNVVLASSLEFTPPPDSAGQLRQRAVEKVSEDITLDGAAVCDALKLPINGNGVARFRLQDEFPSIRRDGVRQAVRRAFDANHTSLEDVQAFLMPRVSRDDIASASGLRTLAGVVSQEFEHVRSERLFRNLMVPIPSGLTTEPADANYKAIPIPLFASSMAASGYAEHRIFTDPVVRSVPLFVKIDGHYCPQFALITACKLLNADLSKTKFTDSSVTLVTPQGDIRIPVRAPYSGTLKRPVGFVMDIPWYGKQQWETMNDWPLHQQRNQHYPIDGVWSVVEAERRLRANEVTLDQCLNFFYDVDHSFKHPDLDRMQAVATLKKELPEAGYDQVLQAAPETLKSELERQIVRYHQAMNSAFDQNLALQAELKQQRALLHQRFAGKAVLIGATATSMGDFVATSLHNNCPGVVVHGVIVNAIVNRDFLTSAPTWLNIGLTLLLGLLATMITCLLPPARAVLLVLLLAAAYFVTNGLLFYDRLNIVLDAASPLLAMIVCWGGVLVARTIIETLERLRMKREAALINFEIDLAKQVQSALMPREVKILAPIDSYGWTKAATTTGGDLFDIWRLDDGRMGFLVADASGHGLGPSIVVSEVRTLIRALCDSYTNPQEVLNVVNKRMVEDLQGKKFCTCFLGFIDSAGEIIWGSAGHGPMLWIPSAGETLTELSATALPLGISDDPCADETIPVLKLEPGGWLAVISDGIFEACNPAGEQFGTQRLHESIAAATDQSSSAIVDTIRRRVDAWQAKPIPDDDQTIVFIRLEPSAIPASTPGDVTSPIPSADLATQAGASVPSA